MNKLHIPNITFISYDAPNWALCGGTLTLAIDGVPTTFGSDADYPCCWGTSSMCGIDGDNEEYYLEGAWYICEHALPPHLRPYADHICDLMNDNAPTGCCGGCI